MKRKTIIITLLIFCILIFTIILFLYRERKDAEIEAFNKASTLIDTASESKSVPLSFQEQKEIKRQQKITAIEQELNTFNENISIVLDDETCAVMFFRGNISLATVFICEGEILDYMDNVVFFRWPGEDHQEEYSIHIKNADKKKFVELLKRYKSLF